MTEPTDLDLSESEQKALHECQLAIEYVHRAYGDLLDFHHNLGHAMDRFSDAEALLREADHENRADELLEAHLPAGAVDEKWSYELVSEFRSDFLAEIVEFEAIVRHELADGIDHVTEREQQSEWRERAGWDE
jgi:hypothetical protein